MSLTTPTTSELEDAIQELARLDTRPDGPRATVAGIDVSGSGAIICLLGPDEPLQPVWVSVKARTPGLAGAREIALQTAELVAAQIFSYTPVAWFERPYGQPSAVSALSRTTGAMAGQLPRHVQLGEIRADAWRKALGIRLGKGSKQRAQNWAVDQLQPGPAKARAARDHNAADAYGVARAILASITKGAP